MLKRNEPEQPDELVWLNDTLVPVTLVPFGTFGDRFRVKKIMNKYRIEKSS